MRAPLSIVIPTLNAANALPDTLACLIEGLEAGLLRELVISDGGSNDATLTIAEDAGANTLSGSPGRGGQLQRGAKAAQGDWLLFLHADTHLPAGWTATLRTHMEHSSKAACFRLQFRANGLGATITAGWANIRTRLGLPYGDQGLLISRAQYDAVGGYPDIPLMEDVAIARALRGKLMLLPSNVTTDATKFQRNGWCRQGTRNMWTLLRYLLGADPERLARRY